MIGKLTDVKVSRLKSPGMYGDGGNLRLQVKEASGGGLRRSWLFKFKLPDQKPRAMGLGPYPDVSLAEARDHARRNRRLLAKGIDPIAHRDAEAAKTAAQSITFRQAADSYFDTFHDTWRPATKSLWRHAMIKHAYPVIGDLFIADIDTAAILRVAKPMWESVPVMGGVTLGHIKRVLDYAGTQGWRERDKLNPATWAGHLEHSLPQIGKIHTVRHQATLPWQKIGECVGMLRSKGAEVCENRRNPRLNAISTAVLEFQILTAVRPTEAREAKWSEVDFAARVWTVHADRMKVGQVHRVPLSDAAITLLRRMESLRRGEFVFLGMKDGPIGVNPLNDIIAALGYTDEADRRITMHGFRSTFSTWARECTNYPRDVIEMALAHSVKSSIEASYFHGDHLEQRRPLMQDWANFCSAPWQPAEVVPIRKRNLAL